MNEGERKDSSILKHGVLNKDLYNSYIINKVQKISKALYLVTNYLDVREPLKWSVRNLSLRFIENSMSLTLSSLSHREKCVMDFVSIAQELDMLIDMAHASGFISGMNADVLRRELASVVVFVEEKHELHYSSSSRLLLTPSYFKVDEIKGGSHPSIISAKKSPALSTAAEPNERRKKILDIGRSLEVFSIKDVSVHIQDCSEKTIQRLLLDMVSEGVLSKEGERRWSRYKIAK